MTDAPDVSKPLSVVPLLAREDDARRVFVERLQRDGFCELLLGGAMPVPLLVELMAKARSFFALPMEAKRPVALAEAAGLRGYVGIGEECTGGIPDHKESFEFAAEFIGADFPPPYDVLHVPNVWPEAQLVPGFRAAAERYIQAAGALGATLFDAMVAACETAETRRSCEAVRVGPPCHFSRLIRYPAGGGLELSRDPLVGHTDHAFFTLGYQTARGLELEMPAGDWVTWDGGQDRLIVFSGEVAAVWSGGAYPAARHRVGQSVVAADRHSVTTFFLPDLAAHIIPLVPRDSAGATDPFGGTVPYRLLDEELKRMHEIFGAARGA